MKVKKRLQLIVRQSAASLGTFPVIRQQRTLTARELSSKDRGSVPTADWMMREDSVHWQQQCSSERKSKHDSVTKSERAAHADTMPGTHPCLPP